MKKNTMVACFTALVIALTTGSSASAALTTDYTKTAGNYSWSNTNIWFLGTLPTVTNSAQIRKVTILAGDTVATVGEMRIFESAILNVQTNIVVNDGAGNGTVMVGYGSVGTLNVTNYGSFTANRLYYGNTANATGNISGGSVKASDIYIAYNAGVTTTVTQTGGNVIATNSVHLNYTAGANGVYHLQAGTLTTATLAFRNQSGSINPFDWTGGTLKASTINYSTASNPVFSQTSGILDPAKINADGSVNEISTLYVHTSLGAASYTLSGAGHLQMQLAGTATNTYDRLLVEGTFTAGGTLDVTLAAGFDVTNLTAGTTFDIIDAAKFSTTNYFSQVNLPALPSGLSWNTDALTTDGTLTVVGPPSMIRIY